MKISIKKAAAVMGCTEQFIRIGMQRNQIDIGMAVKTSSRWTYLIVPDKLAAAMGISIEDLERRMV